jgi:DNA-binding LacI/PurR family transcriptional regulator
VRSSQGKRVVTMEDVAVRAGVSRALVSIVFRGVPGASDENRARVMRAADELSYRPDQRARLLGRGRSRTIGISFGLHDENHGELVEAFYQAADTSGYDLILSPNAPTRGEEDAAQSLLDYRCEALVLIGPSLTRAELEALAAHVPVIVVARALRSAQVDVVRTDDAAGARLAVEHLVDLGHRRIAHVHAGRIAGAAERRAGYRDAMRKHGLEAEVELIAGGRFEDDGWKAADRLLETATAVFTYNDQCSVGLIARLRDRGVGVPGDVSVVGFDDTRLARSASLALTTIAQDTDAIARHALELAIQRSDTTASAGAEIVVAPRLVVRTTTAAPSERR